MPYYIGNCLQAQTYFIYLPILRIITIIAINFGDEAFAIKVQNVLWRPANIALNFPFFRDGARGVIY